MARHRRMVAPIQTIKHYVHLANTVVSSGAIISIVIVDSVVAPATGNAFDVKEGSIVKAVHVEYWLANNGASSQTGQFNFIIEKVPANQASVTAAQILNLGAYTNKKNILFTSQGIQGSAIDGQSALPVVRDWMLIPKGKQRMGLSDRIVVSFAPVGIDFQVCGVTIYKEYS